MVDPTFNDNTALHAPDTYGQSAMLLVESLIHGLIARSVITVGDAIEIVDIAADVRKEIAIEAGKSPETVERSLTSLGAIRASLTIDSPGGGFRPLPASV